MIIYGIVYCATCSANMGQLWGEVFVRNGLPNPSPRLYYCSDCEVSA